MSRPKNPRILVRAELDKLKTWVEIQRSVLRPPSKSEVPAHEYPENRSEVWDNLVKYMQAVQHKAREIEEYAEKRAFELFELRDKA